jgi:hypothetical protein
LVFPLSQRLVGGSASLNLHIPQAAGTQLGGKLFGRLVPFEAKAPQPRFKVHDRRAPNASTRIIVPVGCAV